MEKTETIILEKLSWNFNKNQKITKYSVQNNLSHYETSYHIEINLGDSENNHICLRAAAVTYIESYVQEMCDLSNYIIINKLRQNT